ncbi:MAG: 30S ribosomal protein S3 [Chloroflexi bacterium]|nr:30S ribosomal protein S3 [Chloroflexota bacterium]MBP8058665.1 30S ribosomal protein S3 [Chloroflexota bacterium]
MGRKVHPIGFRLKSIRDWNTRWFAEGDRYRVLLHEDFAIRQLVREELPRAAISTIEIERFPNQVQVMVHSARPGVVIGRKGETVKKLRNKLREFTNKTVKLEIEEITQPDMDATLVAENIAGQLERRISHGRAMKKAIVQAMRQGAKGVRIEVSGRLAGAEMARTEKLFDGRVPRQTIRANIDYGTAEALTTFGRIGVKVWIYKGEILPQKAAEPIEVYVSE